MTQDNVSGARTLRIQWVTSGIEGSRDTGFKASLASNRYRVIAPLLGIEHKGHHVQLVDASNWVGQPSGEVDLVVIGKLLPGRDIDAWRRLVGAVLAQASRIQAEGTPVVADFNDDHFQHTQLGDYWRQLAGLCTLCTAGSETMAAVVQQYTGTRVAVVGDPLGSPAGAPRVFQRPGMLERLLPGRNNPALRLVWFGNAVNWPAMSGWLSRIAPLAHEQPFVLWVITSPHPAIESDIANFNARFAPRAFAELVPWTEETQWQFVADSHAVLIPSDPAARAKTVKTSNRLADAVHAGRHVIASPLPAYEAYGGLVDLTEDPLASLRAYLREPGAWLPRISAAQQLATRLSGLDAISAKWIEAFSTAIEEPRRLASVAPTVPHPTAPAIRLNLGCGDKILPGYVNVDVVASRKGMQPDVICDLHKLEMFEDAHADEVMAIHVVEHFWRWEVEDILREWIRVLKPGGRMILECPNLLSACEAFLKNPTQGALPTQEGQRTMWVFYGDPAWKDPYMIHRWGYTPASLMELMQSVGLRDVRQEPAQYKLREPRDMRIVGHKP